MILLGDCVERMKELPDNSIDAVVTDPPYELGFMGKKWDGTGIAYDVEMWREVLRVLKHGGHLLAFGGTRTYHRMACAIEDAGFEIRDQVQWLYGQGFPKSYNIGKNTDGWDGWGTALKPANEIMCLAHKPLTIRAVCGIIVVNLNRMEEQLCWLRASIVGKNTKSNQADTKEVQDSVQWNVEQMQHILEDLSDQMDMSQLESGISSSLNIVSSWKNILAEASNLLNTYTIEMESSLTIELTILKSLLSALMPQDIIRDATNQDGQPSNVSTVANLFSVVSTKLNYIHTFSVQEIATSKDGLNDLPPNSRPITLARKPLSEKTIVENVLKWGTGGINVDGCRVGTEQVTVRGDGNVWVQNGRDGNPSEHITHQGRFPTNLILDEEAGRMLDEQSGELKSGAIKSGRPNGTTFSIGGELGKRISTYDVSANKGGASRFFYCAKASRKERNAGLEGMEEKVGGGMQGTADQTLLTGSGNIRNNKMQNHHPTVKPISLMRYLCRLITPPNGTVLDPFMGSGTTGCACVQEGFDFVGIEQSDEYIEIAERRIEYWNNSISVELQPSLLEV